MDDEHQTVKALQIHGLTGAGRSNPELIALVVRDPIYGQEIREEDGTAAVVIELRAMPPEEHAKIIEQHSSLEKSPNGRGVVDKVDYGAVDDEVYRRVIRSWRGIVGSDGAPLVCTDLTKVRLPRFLKGQITQKIFGAEVMEITRDTFREPAGVSGMVRG